MDLEITPEPTPEEREALLQALAALNGRHDEPAAWWLAGAREAVEEDEASTAVPGTSGARHSS
jgi:hypothetical protein